MNDIPLWWRIQINEFSFWMHEVPLTISAVDSCSHPYQQVSWCHSKCRKDVYALWTRWMLGWDWLSKSYVYVSKYTIAEWQPLSSNFWK